MATTTAATAIATAATTAIATKTAAKVTTTTTTACAAAGAAVKTDIAAFLWRLMPKPRDDKQRGNYQEKDDPVAVAHGPIIALGPFSNRVWSLLGLKGPVPGSGYWPEPATRKAKTGH